MSKPIGRSADAAEERSPQSCIGGNAADRGDEGANQTPAQFPGRGLVAHEIGKEARSTLSAAEVNGPYIGGATPRPTFTRAASSDPSGSFFAALMNILAPAFSSFTSPGT